MAAPEATRLGADRHFQAGHRPACRVRQIRRGDANETEEAPTHNDHGSVAWPRERGNQGRPEAQSVLQRPGFRALRRGDLPPACGRTVEPTQAPPRELVDDRRETLSRSRRLQALTTRPNAARTFADGARARGSQVDQSAPRGRRAPPARISRRTRRPSRAAGPARVPVPAAPGHRSARPRHSVVDAGARRRHGSETTWSRQGIVHQDDVVAALPERVRERRGNRAVADAATGGLVRNTWSRRSDLNRRPADYESAALPTELRRRQGGQSGRPLGEAGKSRILPRAW